MILMPPFIDRIEVRKCFSAKCPADFGDARLLEIGPRMVVFDIDSLALDDGVVTDAAPDFRWQVKETARFLLCICWTRSL